jgi:hypothetical protein
MTIERGGTIYQTQSLVLAQNQILPLIGNVSYVTVLSATQKDYIEISFTGGAFFPIPPGIAISNFDGPVWIKNTHASANTIVVASGAAELRDNRLVIDVLNPISVTAVCTLADGADVALGAKADAAATTDAGTFTLIALVKRFLGKFGALVKSTYTVNSAASTNAAVIKATAGRVYSADFINATAAIKIVRLYDKATAPTVGTDIAYRTIVLPANMSVHVEWPQGDSYLLGIGIAMTLLIAYNDATAIAANDVQGSVSFE